MGFINSSERGNGPVIILIHGFPFNKTIWDRYTAPLAEKFRVITIDLPGLGKSEPMPAAFTIENVGAEILLFLEAQKIESAVLIGHSLGGYVALAMVSLKPEIFSGLVLFHSTALPDSPEKKENRNKVLDFIDKNGVLAFTSNFIIPLFANQHDPAIDTTRDIATQATEQSVVGYTKAMRDRPDLQEVLTQFHKPVMIISGEKDAGISPDSVKAQTALSDTIELHILKDVAHMGMFEKPVETRKLISDFTIKSNRH
jgi:pimeloyl-ACP methyl ester carboxylesterase